MDLAAELRCKVYEHLLEEPSPIEIQQYRRRPVRKGYGYKANGKKADLVWSERQANWIDQPPSNLAILSVSKQTHKEAAPVAYSNIFSFQHINPFKCFVRGIGSMGKSVRHIEFPSSTSWSRGSNPFDLLVNLINLHSLVIPKFSHHVSLYVAEEYLKGFITSIKTPLKTLYFLHGGEGHESQVSESFKLAPVCYQLCVQRKQEQEGELIWHPRFGMQSVAVCTCGRERERNDTHQERLRSLIEEALKVEEPTDGVAEKVLNSGTEDETG